MSEWDLMIVHYLGLDHIGHASGAFNELVREKLAEMDDVIRQLVSSLHDDDLLLITGDHGMIDQGGHGGASFVETHVPAVFISPRFVRENDSSAPNDDEYLQIDLTATLSAVLEISVPWNNLGVGMTKFWKRFFTGEKNHLVRCLIDDNRRQLLTLLSSRGVSSPSNDLFDIQEEALSLSNEQDSRKILLALLLFTSVSRDERIREKHFSVH
jgi:ethanolamine phosphate transferase 2 subunit G